MFCIVLTYSYLCTDLTDYEQDNIPFNGFSGGGFMGHHVCLYQTIIDGGTHGGTDLCTAIHHRLCDVAGLFPAKEIVQAVCLIMEGRTADGGTGGDGRFVVFPDGEQFDDLYHDDKHVAHRLSESAIRHGTDRYVLSLPATARHSDSGHADGGVGCYRGGAQWPFRAPSVAPG